MRPWGLGKIIVTVFVVLASDLGINNPVGEQYKTIVVPIYNHSLLIASIVEFKYTAEILHYVDSIIISKFNCLWVVKWPLISLQD